MFGQKLVAGPGSLCWVTGLSAHALPIHTHPGCPALSPGPAEGSAPTRVPTTHSGERVLATLWTAPVDRQPWRPAESVLQDGL